MTQTLFRPYHPQDLERVCAFVQTCTHLSPYYNFQLGDLLHWMCNIYRNTNLDQRFGVHENAQGDILAIAEFPPAKRTAFELIVHPHHRGTPLESALLEAGTQHIWAQMQAENIESNQIYCSACSADSTRVGLLEALGYALEKPDFLALTTQSLLGDLPTPVLPEGFHIRPVAGEQDVAQLVEVHSRSFGSSWTEEQYLRVMRADGFHIEREVVVVAPDGRFGAFAVYWLDTLNRVALFEPVGTHPDFQRKGLARALMYHIMHLMQAHGMETAIVNHETDNAASSALYANLGFVRHVTFSDYAKTMTR
jgi:mycothiol synthase